MDNFLGRILTATYNIEGEPGGGTMLTDTGGGGQPGLPPASPADQLPPGQVDPAAAPQFGADDWRATLPPDVQASPTLEKFTTSEGMVRSYMALEQKLSNNLPMPDTDEHKAEIYAALGRPEAPDQYEFQPLEMPQGMEHDGDGEQYFRNVVHEAGLSSDQAQMLHNKYYGLMVQRHASHQQAMETARQEAERALKREQGPAYDGFLAGAKGALREFASPEFLQRLDQTGMGNDPEMIRVFGRIGKRMGGDTSLVSGAAQHQVPGDAQKAAMDYRNKHSEALYNSDHVEHSQRVAELTALMNQAFPDG